MKLGTVQRKGAYSSPSSEGLTSKTEPSHCLCFSSAPPVAFYHDDRNMVPSEMRDARRGSQKQRKLEACSFIVTHSLNFLRYPKFSPPSQQGSQDKHCLPVGALFCQLPSPVHYTSLRSKHSNQDARGTKYIHHIPTIINNV